MGDVVVVLFAPACGVTPVVVFCPVTPVVEFGMAVVPAVVPVVPLPLTPAAPLA